MYDHTRPSLFRLLCCFLAVSPLLLLGVVCFFDNHFGYFATDGQGVCTKYILGVFGEEIPIAVTIDSIRLRLSCIFFLSGVIVFLREGIFHVPSEGEEDTVYFNDFYDFINEIIVTLYCLYKIFLRTVLLLPSVYAYLFAMTFFATIEGQAEFDIQMLWVTIPLSIIALLTLCRENLIFLEDT